MEGRNERRKKAGRREGSRNASSKLAGKRGTRASKKVKSEPLRHKCSKRLTRRGKRAVAGEWA